MTERREELREEFSSEDVDRVPENEDGGNECLHYFPDYEEDQRVMAGGPRAGFRP